MEFIAKSKNIKISPRKVRLVADLVRKYEIAPALVQLAMSGKRAASPLKKTLESAIANAVNNFKAVKNDLFIKEISVNEAGTYKRFHFAGRGRTRPYKKRMSHITVILEQKVVAPVTAPALVEKNETKEEKKGKKV